MGWIRLRLLLPPAERVASLAVTLLVVATGRGGTAVDTVRVEAVLKACDSNIRPEKPAAVYPRRSRRRVRVVAGRAAEWPILAGVEPVEVREPAQVLLPILVTILPVKRAYFGMRVGVREFGQYVFCSRPTAVVAA